jgi:hypothetical protein
MKGWMKVVGMPLWFVKSDAIAFNTRGSCDEGMRCEF